MLLTLLLACVHRPPLVEGSCPPTDPARITAAREEAIATGPLTARFSIHIERGEKTINAQGAMLVDPAGRFRIEISGPVGPPQLVLATDGHRVAAWQAGEHRLYEANDATLLLDRVSGGAVDLPGLAAALLARVPAPGAGVTTPTDPARWSVPGRAEVSIGTDCRRGDQLASLKVTRPDGALLLDLLGDTAKGQWRNLSLGLPSVRLGADLVFDTWRPATPADSAFDLRAPPNAEVVDLGLLLAFIPAGTAAPTPALP